MPVDAASVRTLRAQLPNLPDWAGLIGREQAVWVEARRRAQAGGPRVLLATGAGGGTSSALAAFESLLAVALTLRGADVTVVLCDRALPACMNLEILTYPDTAAVGRGEYNATAACAQCERTGAAIFEPLGLQLLRFNELHGAASWLPVGVEDWLHGGRLAIDEHAQAGALRYLARSDLAGVAEGPAVLARYREAARRTRRVIERAIDRVRPNACVSSHGLYIPYGTIGETCRRRGVRYAAWNVAYRRQCFIFSHGDTYHHTLLDEPVSAWEGLPWDEGKETRIREYLASRVTGSNDWVWFFERPENDVDGTFARKGVTPDRPVVLLLTNVMWDAQLHYRANAFPSMLDWILETVEWFRGRPELQLVIRVHPAEMRPTLPSRQRVAEELAQRYPRLPDNVVLIGPEEQLSTYALAQRCDSALIYGTKTGVELACLGIPVVVAGEAWVRGKGITFDADSRESYRRCLAALPFARRLPEEMQQRALKYAYHFFFRRMIPVAAVQPAHGGWPPFHVVPESLARLAPGVDAGIDVICDGILRGSEFVFDRGIQPTDKARPANTP